MGDGGAKILQFVIVYTCRVSGQILDVLLSVACVEVFVKYKDTSNPVLI
jgi:hypothetical protein